MQGNKTRQTNKQNKTKQTNNNNKMKKKKSSNQITFNQTRTLSKTLMFFIGSLSGTTYLTLTRLTLSNRSRVNAPVTVLYPSHNLVCCAHALRPNTASFILPLLFFIFPSHTRGIFFAFFDIFVAARLYL